MLLYHNLAKNHNNRNHFLQKPILIRVFCQKSLLLPQGDNTENVPPSLHKGNGQNSGSR